MQYAERFNKRIVNQSKDEVSRVLDRSKLVIFLRHRFLLSLPFLIQFSSLASESERSEDGGGNKNSYSDDGRRLSEGARRFSSLCFIGKGQDMNKA